MAETEATPRERMRKLARRVAVNLASYESFIDPYMEELLRERGANVLPVRKQILLAALGELQELMALEEAASVSEGGTDNDSREVGD